MLVFQRISEFQKWRDENASSRVAFVPTMGALHEGHLELFKAAKKYGEKVVVSVFVNPTQFNDPKDFEKYPRTLEDDLKKCESVGVNVVFTPTAEEMYPQNETLKIIPVPAVAQPLEGITRPGHFQGVITIVAKLFHIVNPHAALFGLKDYQQVRVIEEMANEQQFPVAIIPCPIVRSHEGLALSSRNQRLSKDGLQKALRLSQTLSLAKTLFKNGTHDPKILKEKLTTFLSEDSAIKIDSVDIVDARTLLESPTSASLLVALAAFVEGVRLIDNCILE